MSIILISSDPANPFFTIERDANSIDFFKKGSVKVSGDSGETISIFRQDGFQAINREPWQNFIDPLTSSPYTDYATAVQEIVKYVFDYGSYPPPTPPTNMVDYAADNSESTTLLDTWQSKVTTSPTLPAGDYLISANYELQSASNELMEVKLMVGGNEIAMTSHEKVNNDAWINQTPFGVVSHGGGPLSVDLQYRFNQPEANPAYVLKIRRARIAIQTA